MAQVLIRQLDDQVVAALRARARARGVSLEQSLRDLLTATARQGHAHPTANPPSSVSHR